MIGAPSLPRQIPAKNPGPAAHATKRLTKLNAAHAEFVVHALMAIANGYVDEEVWPDLQVPVVLTLYDVASVLKLPLATIELILGRDGMAYVRDWYASTPELLPRPEA